MQDRGRSPLFEIAGVRVRLDDVARFVVNAHDSIIRTAAKLCLADDIADCV